MGDNEADSRVSDNRARLFRPVKRGTSAGSRRLAFVIIPRAVLPVITALRSTDWRTFRQMTTNLFSRNLNFHIKVLALAMAS